MSGSYNGLEQRPNFILWKSVWSEEKRKNDKIPVDYRTGYNCDPNLPAAQTDLETIQEAAKKFGLPIGYQITADSPFFFIDIDSAIGPDGQWRPECLEIYRRFPGALWEISQSGTGMHIIGSCDKSIIQKNRRCNSFKYDNSFDALFTEMRFVALTGTSITGDATTDHTAALYNFVEERLISDATAERGIDWTDEPIEGPGLSDAAILQKAMKSKSTPAAFGHTVKFIDLWEANAEVLGQHWPDDHQGRPYDPTRADAALAQHLAFWTGGNCEQIQRLMYMSALAREKWELRADYYIPRTIRLAVERQSKFYTGRKDGAQVSTGAAPSSTPDDSGAASLQGNTVAPSANENGAYDIIPTTAEGLRYRDGYQLLTARSQASLFAGCVYIRKIHAVMTPDGDLVEPSSFKAFYGGFVFQLDGDEKTTTNAFQAFTESQLVDFPKVRDMFFDPKLPPLALRDGRVNTYVPLDIPAEEGDVTPFLEHVEKLIPHPGDREILFDYMAACIQRPGDKFQWCPLIQGMEGNGKTLLATVLRNAIGAPYYHQEDPDDIKNTFNSWLERSIIVSIEEIFVNSRYELSNRMRAMITNDYSPIHAKRKDQRSAPNCAKFILFSNHKDGVYKHRDDRRYAIFYTAQQDMEDLAKAGMDEHYFTQLYSWVKSDEGIKALNWWLRHREVRTNVMGRAPETSSTREAVFESLPAAERMLLEAIETDEIGLRHDIIAAPYADAIIAEAGLKKAGPKARNRILSNIGYVPLGGASDGKIQIDGRRMKFYIKKASILSGLSSEEIRNLYLKYNHSAQTG